MEQSKYVFKGPRPKGSIEKGRVYEFVVTSATHVTKVDNPFWELTFSYEGSSITQHGRILDSVVPEYLDYYQCNCIEATVGHKLECRLVDRIFNNRKYTNLDVLHDNFILVDVSDDTQPAPEASTTLSIFKK